MTELSLMYRWVWARWETARRTEDGVSAVEWLLILVGTAAIAIAAVAAVRAWVTDKTGDLPGG